jgi:TorA maturation chaperone TorD
MTANAGLVSVHGRDKNRLEWLLIDPRESYLFCAAILAPPGDALVRLLRNDSELLDSMSWLDAYADDVALLRALQVEHTRLFVNAIPGLEVPPYAAFYLELDHPQAWLVRIRDRLSALGLEPVVSHRERLDHIAVLLEAAGRIQESLVRCVFIEEFLVTWIRSYSQKLVGAAALPLYPEFVAAAAHLVDADSRSLNS